MAELIVGAIGAGAGFAVGGPKGAMLGWSIGTLVGGALFPSNTQGQSQGRLSDLQFSGSSFGVTIPQVFGRYRVPGTIIWIGHDATGHSLRESYRTKRVGGFLGQRVRTYFYTVDLAVAVCRGPVNRILRIWGDDILIYTSGQSETQRLLLNGATGTYVLTFDGQSTSAISVTASAATLKAALEALSNIGVGDISVTDIHQGVLLGYLVTFQGALSGVNVSLLTVSASTGGPPTVSVFTSLTSADLTFYYGDLAQLPDADLEAVELAGNVPGYRQLCYVVLKNLELTAWGQRIPNFSFEVERVGSVVNVVEDSFDRANGGLGVADSGQTWQDPSGATIVSNQCLLGTSLLAPWIDSGLTNCAIEVTVALVGTNANGIMFRYVDSINYWHFSEFLGDYRLVKYEAAIPNDVAVTAIIPADGDVLKVELEGDTIRCYVNGTLEITFNDSFNNTSTKHGMMGTGLTSLLDNFTLGPLASTSILLSDILGDLFDQVGLDESEYDVSAATSVVDGFAITQRSEVRSVIDPLLRIYDTDLAEIDGQIVAIPRGGAVVATINPDDLGARIITDGAGEPQETKEIIRRQDLELPRRLELIYVNSLRGYQNTSQSAVRQTKGSVQNPTTITVPLVLTDNAGKQQAEKLLYQAWLEREPIQVQLMPRYGYLTPGDVIDLPTDSSTFRCRIVGVEPALPGPINMALVLDEAAILTQTITGAETEESADITLSFLTTAHIWSGNALQNEDADSIGFYASAGPADGGEWIGCAIYWSRDSGVSYEFLGDVTDEGAFGAADTVLAAGTSTAVWDDTNTVDVTMVNGVPETASDMEVINGANSALLGNEAIRFAVVTALGGDTYRLSRLLRGQRGTDGHWSEHRLGERFVLLPPDGAAERFEMPIGIRGARLYLKVVGFRETVANATPFTIQLSGDEFKPYAPVNITATRNGPLDISTTWLRRTRKTEGLQDMVDEPPAEDVEAYQVAVRSGVPKTITGISSATQGVISSTAHGFSIGNQVYLRAIVGAIQLNGQIVTITAVTANDFTISEDTSQIDAYFSGGTAEKVLRIIDSSTTSAVYLASQQVTDWGSAQPSVPISVFMLGRYGHGYSAEAVV